MQLSHNVKRENPLEWLGGNLALDYPVCETVRDKHGNIFDIDLKQVLQRLDDFVGYRGNQRIKDNLIDNCFTAYEYNQFSESERVLFEEYVRNEAAKISPVDAARKMLLS